MITDYQWMVGTMAKRNIALLLLVVFTACGSDDEPLVSDSPAELGADEHTSAVALVEIPPTYLDGGGAVTAPLPLEQVGHVEQVPAEPQPHWVWVSDQNFGSMPDGRAVLVDGDSGRVFGMLNTGYAFIALTLPSSYHEIYSAETYYSRTTRGERTDVVSIYDPVDLTPKAEIVIPPKRASSIPVMDSATLTDDGQYMAVFNMTPGTSLSIVDVKTRQFVGEIPLNGCTMVWPAGTRRYFTMCSDGSMRLITIDDDGKLTGTIQSRPFFAVLEDPVTEKPVRYGEKWVFVSFRGLVHEADLSGEIPTFADPWNLLQDADALDSWRPGGMQHLAMHEPSGRLFSLMHEGGGGTHQAPGNEVWVYDLATRERVQRIELQEPAMSIQVSRDTAPLMFTVNVTSRALQVYDANDGRHLRTVEEVSLTPCLLQLPWSPAL